MPDAMHGEDAIYRTLFECAGDAIFIHNASKIMAVNRKACEMLGYTEDELLILLPSEIDDTNHRMYLPERMAKLKKHKSISFETFHQKKDGTSIPVEVTAQSITWNDELAVMSICRDNTKKRNYDNVLLDAALGWQQTFDAIKDAVFLMSPDHRILRCNKASYKVFNNFKPGEILGKRCWEIVHGTSEKSPSCSIRVMEKTKKRKTSILKSDGRWLEITADPVLDKGNNITGVIHIVSDITERKLADEALRRKNQVFDVSIAANSIADLDGLITEANDAFLQVWGYPHKEEVIGKPIPHFLNDPDMAVPILKALNDNGRWEGSYTAKRKDGATFIAHGMATVLRDEDGKVTGYQSAVMDITEQKRMEDALRESQKHYRNLVEGTSDLVTRVNADARFLFVNHAAREIYGITPEACIGRLAFDFVHPEDREMTMAAFQNWLRDGRETFTLENRMINASGRTHYLSWLIRAEYDEKGNVKGFLSAARDITKHKLADEKLKRLMEDLKRANTDLERFVSVVNHDLLAPLRSILSFLIMIEEKYKKMLDEEACGYIGLAVSGARRMENLLAGLLEYSRVHTYGKELKPIKAHEALDDAIGNLRGIVGEANAEITADPLGDVNADRMQLAQLFQNLLSNAIKFRNGHRVQIHISCKKEAERLLFSVQDDGIGIKPEHHERIFSIFRKVNPDDECVGHGIGLAICKNIVERHGGRIWVESEPGKGATFFFTLPNAPDVSRKG